VKKPWKAPQVVSRPAAVVLAEKVIGGARQQPAALELAKLIVRRSNQVAR